MDDDPVQFTVNELLRIKTLAESRARSELELPMRATEAFNWEAFQLSRVSTYSVPICLRGDGAGSVDNAAFARFNDQLHSMLSYAFGHACVTTPYDEFVYLLSLDHEERTTKPRHMLNNGCVVWDQADKCPDMEKVLSMARKIADSTSFSWEQLQLDRLNPEAWEFIGER